MKSKILKKIGIILTVIGALLILTAAILFIFIIKRPTQINDFSRTKLNTWNKITLDDSVKSGDGSEYYLLTKRGNSNNWIIFFSGGGMNWDEATTAAPITVTGMLQKEALTYFANITFLQSNTRYDNLLIYYQARLNDVQTENSQYKYTWSGQMLNSAKNLSGKFNNYHYFIIDYSLDIKNGTTSHTLSVVDSFYDTVEDRISLCDWLFNTVENGLKRNVGNCFINKTGGLQ